MKKVAFYWAAFFYFIKSLDVKVSINIVCKNHLYNKKESSFFSSTHLNYWLFLEKSSMQ
jgi:hypothetical protein